MYFYFILQSLSMNKVDAIVVGRERLPLLESKHPNTK
jgi:hypothetical protein